MSVCVCVLFYGNSSLSFFGSSVFQCNSMWSVLDGFVVNDHLQNFIVENEYLICDKNNGKKLVLCDLGNPAFVV